MNQATPGLIPLTAIILTHNEATNIAKCLAHLERISDVVLLDSGSTDNTIAAARAVRPDVRVYHHAFSDFGHQRNWALENTSPQHQWVLFVDADEFCTPSLLDEIQSLVGNPGDAVGGFIAGKVYFLGKWLKHSTMYPSYQLRLLKPGHVRFRKDGHGQKEVTHGPTRYLRSAWRHEALSKGVHQWIDRHNRYSTEEAHHLIQLRKEAVAWRGLFSSEAIVRRRALKAVGARLPFRPVLRWLHLYIFKRGFLDGIPGFLYCALLFAHEIQIAIKIAEIQRTDLADDCIASARSGAEPLVPMGSIGRGPGS